MEPINDKISIDDSNGTPPNKDYHDAKMDHSASDNKEDYSDYDSVDDELHDSAMDDSELLPNPCQTNPSFESCYACYSLSKAGKPHLEHGDQIIMPESSLHKLLSLRIKFPMLFQIRNDWKERVSHCGVSEFTAEEGTVLLPSWMMKNLKLEEGELITLKSVDLQKGTYVKLQPHSVDFLEIRNPKSVLEDCLCRKFFCLTIGDTIKINYNNKDLLVDIVDAKPDSAVCIVDTDCEVDFAPPLDYNDPVIPEEVKVSGFIPFSGVGRRLDGRPVLPSPVGETSQAVGVKRKVTELEKPTAKSMFVSSSKAQDRVDKTETVPKKEFQPFTGKKYTLS